MIVILKIIFVALVTVPFLIFFIVQIGQMRKLRKQFEQDRKDCSLSMQLSLDAHIIVTKYTAVKTAIQVYESEYNFEEIETLVVEFVSQLLEPELLKAQQTLEKIKQKVSELETYAKTLTEK